MSAPSRSPRVTVVVIVRNGEDFLEESLRSIAAQSLADLETIVVDDGSSDGTVALAERFAAGDARFRVVRHEGGANRGMSASRNLGRRHARSGFLTFLDHDDVMEPTKLERQLELLGAAPEAGALLTPNLRWHSWRIDGRAPADEVQDLGLTDGLHPPPGILPVYLGRTNATPQSPLIRTDAFDAVGGYDESFPSLYEDQVFLSKLALAFPVLVRSEVLHRYRQHADSCVHRSLREGRSLAARARFLDWLEAHLAASPGAADGAARQLRRAIVRERRRLWMRRLRRLVRLRR